MKKLLSLLLALVMIFSMSFTLMGCEKRQNDQNQNQTQGDGQNENKPNDPEDHDDPDDPEDHDDPDDPDNPDNPDDPGKAPTLRNLFEKFDAEKGVSLEVEGQLSMLYDLMFGNGSEEFAEFDVKASFKAKLEGGAPWLDFALTVAGETVWMDEDAEELFGKGIVEAYIRDSVLYFAEKQSADGNVSQSDLLFEQSDAEGMAEIKEYITQFLDIVEEMKKQPIELGTLEDAGFKKEADGYRLEIDLVQIFTETLTAANEFLQSLTADVTLGDLYKNFHVKESLTEIFGNMKLTEAYASLKEALGQMGDAQIMLPESLDGPDGLIPALNMMLSESFGVEIALPEAGDKTVVSYLDEIIAPFKPVSLGDILTMLAPMMGMEDVSPEEFLATIQSIAGGFIEDMTDVLALNTLKIKLFADKDGHLASVTVEAVLDRALIELMNGGFFDTTAKDPVFSCNLTVTFQYGEIEFCDVSALPKKQ